MAYTNVKFIGGINKETTEYGAEGQWVDGDKIRFRYGLPQKIGGWVKASTFALMGVARGLFSWFDLSGTRFAAIGTNRKVYLFEGDNFYDITPIRATFNTQNNCFTTTNGSAIFTVAVTNHGCIAGEFVTISGTTSLAGTTSFTAANFNQQFEVQTVINADKFTLTMATNNTETAAGITTNGTASFVFQLEGEPATQTFGYGWGTNTWGTSTWGTARSTSNVILDAGIWHFDNAGEDLFAWLKNGGLYKWDTSAGVGTQLTIVTNAPTKSVTGLISTPDRHAICFGTTLIGSTTQDKMFIRWSSQENFTTWTPGVTNTSGSQRLGEGSRIIAAQSTRGEILVWTDTALHSMQFIGPPYIFGFRLLGTDCGLVALNAAVVVNDKAYWMADGRFMTYAGAIQEIPCSVKQYVFNDINRTQYSQVYAGENNQFNEVVWYYCSASSSEIDRYVIYNYVENVWYIGNLNRTAWIDNAVFQQPMALNFSPTSTAATQDTIFGATAGRSFLFNHESGTSDDGAILESTLTSGDADIADGDTFTFIRGIIPDFKNLAGTVKMVVQSRDFPADSQTTTTNLSVTSSTRLVNMRARGRQVSLKIFNDTSTSDNWRFGTLRMDTKQDGRR
jgi:hypothetical protein